MRILIFFLTMNSVLLFAQNPYLDMAGSGPVKFHPGYKSLNGVDYSEVQGNCYWKEDWAPAIVTLMNGKKARMPKVKMNFYTNEVHYIDKQNVEWIVQAKSVRNVAFYSMTDSLRSEAVFESLANKFSDYKSAYFQVLNEGPTQLLKKTGIILNKQEASAYSTKKAGYQFVPEVNYFLRKEIELNPLKKINKASVFSVIKMDEEIEKWMDVNNKKMKSEEDVVDLLAFINSGKS